MTYFELRTLKGSSMRGWMNYHHFDDRLLCVTRMDESVIVVPIAQLDYFEELPDGHSRIPAWANENRPEGK